MEIDNEHRYNGFLVYFLLGLVGGIMGSSLIGKETKTGNYIPRLEQVQQGYVVPSKLEIELQDLDGNGQKEVFMKYNGMKYPLTLDEQGKPRVQAYEIEPVEVLKKE